MAFLLPVPNGNPWPKSWSIQLPILGNNISNPKSSRFQQTLKLAYTRDIRSFRKYYNKNVKQVVCSGITMPRVVSARCKLVTTLELYEHSQMRSKLPNVKAIKFGQLSQRKGPMQTVKRLIRYNKNLEKAWIDRFETIEAVSSAMKCPRELNTFSLGVCNVSKEKMKEGLRFLTRHPKLKEIGLCSTEPLQVNPNRPIDKEAKAFASFIGSLMKKANLKSVKLDIMDPQVVQSNNMFNDFLLAKLNQTALEHFDIRLALTNPISPNQVLDQTLGRIDYFGLSLDGTSFQKSGFWAEDMLNRQKNSNRKLMVDFRGLTELDLNPLLMHVTPSLRALDLSFNNDNCSFNCNWNSVLSQLKSLQSLSINFNHCSGVMISTLKALSYAVAFLPSLKCVGIHMENISFTPETYAAIDQFYASIQDISEHSFGLQSPVSENIQLESLCNSISRLESLKKLKFMMHLRTINSVLCVGTTICQLRKLEKLDIHVRLDTHEIMPFTLPLESLSHLNHLRIELLFRPSAEFLDTLNPSIARLAALQHLDLTILYYSKIRYSIFKGLLARLNLLKELKELEMSVNIEDENVNESLTEKNFKLRREFQELLSRHPSLTKVMFHHFVSYICCTR